MCQIYCHSLFYYPLRHAHEAVSEGKNKIFLCVQNFLCQSVLGKVLNSSLIGFRALWPLSVHTEHWRELTACETDEGQDSAGVTVFTVTAVRWAHLGKVIQELLRGLWRLYHRRRRRQWYSRWRRGESWQGCVGSPALVSLTVWKIKKDHQNENSSRPPILSHLSLLPSFPA